jgi:sigma-B regulation protein RsbU (phosphoserine phosphatase)
VYVIVPYEDHLLYIWDFSADGSSDHMDLGDTENYIGYGEEAALEAFNVKTGQSYNPFVITNSQEYGKLVSAYVPIFDSNGDPQAVVGVDMDVNDINSTILSFLIIVVVTILIIILIIYFIFYFLIRRKIIKPINSLNDAAENFVDNQMEKGENIQLNIKTGDEIESLANAFSHMSAKLNDYIANLRKITAEKEKVSAELNVATQIQADMLPSVFPPYPDRKDFDIFASMKPAKEVGGDLYDFFLINEDLFAVVIADVSGKGVPASLFMAITKTLIKNHAQAGESPEQVFTHVNRQLCENDKSGLFVTGWMAYIRLSTGEVTFVNAGHNPPLIRKAGGSYEYLKCRPNCILAAFDDTEYKQETLVMEPGAVLYLYTDGVTEATNTEKELFGEDRLKQSLDARIGQPISEVLPGIKQDLDDFVKEAPQFDDITMLIFRRNGTEENAAGQ